MKEVISELEQMLKGAAEFTEKTHSSLCGYGFLYAKVDGMLNNLKRVEQAVTPFDDADVPNDIEDTEEEDIEHILVSENVPDLNSIPDTDVTVEDDECNIELGEVRDASVSEGTEDCSCPAETSGE